MKQRKFVASFRGNHGRTTSVGRDSLLWLCDALAHRASRLWFDDSGVLWMHEHGNPAPVIVKIQGNDVPFRQEIIKEVLLATLANRRMAAQGVV